ncbi:MAG: helix-turn-helix transcriptional regulator [Nitrosopumilus sp.]|nr:helix-turn-helix transcriptional regulator [Nitrosopumilus sp.]MBL7015407.1 helix-turn-helix transcriptional regulator [Nitrosopumilus sp.]MBL7018449.1 helix-turn-helix transcriptional regulator [Nitrosopumilus sp.]
MSDIDQLFAAALEQIIQENLGDTTFRSIQNRLFEKYGISITQSIIEFEKLDSVLTEFFGSGAKGLEKKFLDSICSIKSKEDRIKKRFTISNPSINQSILKAFSDDEMSKILNASIGEPWTISQILEKLDIPQTSGYRKINLLIKEGLLIKTWCEFTENRRNVYKYKSLFDNVNIDFNNKVTVNVQFTPEAIKDSVILQTVYGK